MTGTAPLGDLAVLVVEDEQLVAMLIEDALLDAGATVLGPTSTVAETLALLRSSTPAVAVMDMNLCGESAAPVADALAALGVPFLVATGYAMSSQRQLVECFRVGAERFGWNQRHARPGTRREGRWLIGMGTAAALRGNALSKSAARVRLDARGMVTVESDMTDIGTGSYTVIAQTAAEMMGVPLQSVVVKLGDSTFPVSCGSGGQWGGNSATAGV
ncbi:MAG: molybdopterin cofactor-binding domain-containing protein, partial [Pseudomonadota bacterium]